MPSITTPLDNAPAVEDDGAVAALFIPRHPTHFASTVRSLREAKLPIVLGTPHPSRLGPLGDLGLQVVQTWSATALVNDVWRERRTNILAVVDAVLVPPDFLERGLDLVKADLRVATVSFLSNAAAFLSFPHRNQPVDRPVEGHDERSITRTLRKTAPTPAAVPIPFATGAAVLISNVAIGTTGLLQSPPSGDFGAAIADFSFNCRSRGFLDLLDSGTFYSRPSDISVEPRRETVGSGLTLEDNGWLHERHRTAHRFVDEERTSRTSALALALSVARAKIVGLKVLVDGTCLGAQEMGTQVATVALINALAARRDVREVCVVLPGPIPSYARDVLTRPKVTLGTATNGQLPDFGRADIGHRPFQPNEDFDVDQWHGVADRIVVTVHDLISFHIGSYSGDTETWLRYRRTMEETVRRLDAVVVDSADVRKQFELHRLPVAPDRVLAVPLGTEHLTGGESARIPDALAERGFVAGQFLLCLGTNYTHKNRDLALLAYLELRRRGHDCAVVLAGPGVPWGSSRIREALAGDDDLIFVLPDVASDERNWLLRHASLVLYPSSAEGFGLVPFEAARFGTPTVYVGFGPLAEIGGDQPITARDWKPESLADAAEALLSDPALAARQVEACVAAGTEYTWAGTAERLVALYRQVLLHPSARA